MIYIFKMALRNVSRNRRRSLLAALSICLSVMFILFMKGMADGFLDSMVRNYTRSETGHIRITTRGFEERQRFYPVNENIKNPDKIIESINGHSQIEEHITLITERTQFGVLLSNEGRNKSAAILAGEPYKEKELFMLQKSILPGGRYLENGRDVIIGKKIAQALEYNVGDTVSVVTEASDHSLNMRNFVVAGIFETGLNLFDDGIAQIGIDDAKHLLRTGADVQQIIIMLDDYRNAEMVAGQIRNLLQREDLSVNAWTQIGDYGNMVRYMEVVYGTFYMIIALLGAFIVGNIMMMVVLERRKEIGIIKSMGLNQREILFMFLAEGAILGLIGSIAGTVLGGVVVTYFHVYGMDFTAMVGDLKMPMDNVVYFAINPVNFFMTLILAILFSSFMSFGPAWRASRLSAVKAIKGV